jgi:hypothetical protein
METGTLYIGIYVFGVLSGYVAGFINFRRIQRERAKREAEVTDWLRSKGIKVPF